MWVWGFFFVGASGGPVQAAETVDPFTEPDESELFRAEERVVTVAGRYAQSASRVSSVVTVYTAAELRERGYRTLADALASVPGFYITTSEEGRSLAWVRGVLSSDNNKILLLVDGVPWYDGVYTHAWIDEFLPMALVRQIEVIRGPASSVYGTNAFAGVINVVTWSPGTLQDGFLRVEGGTHGHLGGSAVYAERLPSRSDALGVRAWVDTHSSDGDGVALTPDGARNVLETAPEGGLAAGLGLDWRGLSLRYDHVGYHHSPLLVEIDDPIDVLLNDPDAFRYTYQDEFFSARWALSPVRWLQLTPYSYLQHYNNPGLYARLGAAEVDADTSEAAWDALLVVAEKESERYGAGLEVELRPFVSHVTVLGLGLDSSVIDTLQDQIFLDGQGTARTTSFFAPRMALLNPFGFVQHHWSASWWLDLDASLRVDRRSYVCLQDAQTCPSLPVTPMVSPRAGATFTFGTGAALKAMAGQAFRAPSARELLVSVGTDDDGTNLATASNPDLRPEVIQTAELELLLTPVRPLTVRVDGYVSALHDEIAKVTASADAAGEYGPLGDDYYDNLSGEAVVGGELELGLSSRLGELGAVGAWTRAIDTDSGALQYGFPPLALHAHGQLRPVPGLSLGAQVDAYGARPRAGWDDALGIVALPPYALLNLSTSTNALADGRVRVDLAVHNVLGTVYKLPLYQDSPNALDEAAAAANAYGVEGPGRSVQVGLELTF